ncbi:hypothetical protein KEM55_003435, partial [Ascosphaera atra]
MNPTSPMEAVKQVDTKAQRITPSSNQTMVETASPLLDTEELRGLLEEAITGPNWSGQTLLVSILSSVAFSDPETRWALYLDAGGRGILFEPLVVNSEIKTTCRYVPDKAEIRDSFRQETLLGAVGVSDFPSLYDAVVKNARDYSATSSEKTPIHYLCVVLFSLNETMVLNMDDVDIRTLKSH